MSDPNLTLVYSPKGDTAEVTPLNARDLVTHYGWSYERLVLAATPAPAAPAPTPEPAPAAPAAPAPAAPVTETPAPAAPVADAEKPFTTVAEFDHLADKADVQAYIAKTFPDAKVDGRANRDKLVVQAIELAAAAAEAE